MITTNFTVSWDDFVRDVWYLPICDMVDVIRIKLMVKFQKREMLLLNGSSDQCKPYEICDMGRRGFGRSILFDERQMHKALILLFYFILSFLFCFVSDFSSLVRDRDYQRKCEGSIPGWYHETKMPLPLIHLWFSKPCFK